MLSTLSNIVNSTIISKLGDWAIEIYKIVTGKKDKDKENSTSVVVNIIQNPQSPASNQLVEPSLGVVLPPPPAYNKTSSDGPPSSVILPSSASTEGNEPEFGSDEYVTQLLKAIYKNKRSNDDFGLGLGNTDELSNKGDRE